MWLTPDKAEEAAEEDMPEATRVCFLGGTPAPVRMMVVGTEEEEGEEREVLRMAYAPPLPPLPAWACEGRAEEGWRTGRISSSFPPALSLASSSPQPSPPSPLPPSLLLLLLLPINVIGIGVLARLQADNANLCTSSSHTHRRRVCPEGAKPRDGGREGGREGGAG